MATLSTPACETSRRSGSSEYGFKPARSRRASAARTATSGLPSSRSTSFSIARGACALASSRISRAHAGQPCGFGDGEPLFHALLGRAPSDLRPVGLRDVRVALAVAGGEPAGVRGVDMPMTIPRPSDRFRAVVESRLLWGVTDDVQKLGDGHAMTTKTISLADLDAALSDTIAKVRLGGERYLLTRFARPACAIVPIADLQLLEKLDEAPAAAVARIRPADEVRKFQRDIRKLDAQADARNDGTAQLAAQLADVAARDQAESAAREARLTWMGASELASKAARAYRELASCSFDQRAVEKAHVEALNKAEDAAAAERKMRDAEDALAKIGG